MIFLRINHFNRYSDVFKHLVKSLFSPRFFPEDDVGSFLFEQSYGHSDDVFIGVAGILDGDDFRFLHTFIHKGEVFSFAGFFDFFFLFWGKKDLFPNRVSGSGNGPRESFAEGHNFRIS